MHEQSGETPQPESVNEPVPNLEPGPEAEDQQLVNRQEEQQYQEEQNDQYSQYTQQQQPRRSDLRNGAGGGGGNNSGPVNSEESGGSKIKIGTNTPLYKTQPCKFFPKVGNLQYLF